jgi:Putative metallopeptidase
MGIYFATRILQLLVPGIRQADSSLRSFATWCEQQRGTLAMFTKTLSALAIVLSTVSGAVAVTKHEGTAAKRELAIKASRQNPRDKADFVIGNVLFVGFHEMGHALADQFHLPTLGRAEDAADSFATIALLDASSEFSINVLVQAARGLFLSDRRDRKQREELDFSDAHGLDRQRAFQIICLMVGSNQEQFKELANWVRMPRDRQRNCANDYEDAKYAWHSLLESHRHADGQPTATIEIAYEPGQSNLERYARSFQSVALLEALSDYASSRYALPRPIKMVMASCGDANAAWVSSANTETLCYELADDFFDLYDGFTTNGKVQDHGLVSKNVARISLVHNAPAGTLDKVAMEMNGAASALFTKKTKLDSDKAKRHLTK